MADKDLTTDITKETELEDADFLYIVNGGNSRAITWANLKAELAREVLGKLAPVKPSYASDFYLSTPLTSNASSYASATVLANYMFFYPVIVPEDRTFTTLAIKVTTGQASSNVGMAIYDSDGTNYRPGTLLASSGDISTATSGIKTATVSQALTAGQMVWLCVWNDSDTSKVVSGLYPSLTSLGILLEGSNGGGANNGLLYRSVTFNTASWPDPAGATAEYAWVNGNNPPIIGMR